MIATETSLSSESAPPDDAFIATAATHEPHLVERRRMPYPHRAALAICSDLDETRDLTSYLRTMQLLNETGSTPLGAGLGLEVGNTIYFDMPANQFSYWNTDDRGRETVRGLIRSGHIDCLHSFGDLATERRHAERALEELQRHGVALDVWIDHAVAPSNFGSDIMCGEGDVADAPAFHADLSCAFGIQYVWRGRVTSVVGQDIPRRLDGIFVAKQPFASGRTFVKEACKGLLGRAGSPKYDMHAANALLRPVELRSGHRVFEFLRCNPHWGGVSSRDTGDGLGEVLHEEMYQRLIEREGMCILYTHLGKTADPSGAISGPAIAALRRLAAHHDEGRILVTTTRRLLQYCRRTAEITWAVRIEGGTLYVDVRSSDRTSPIPSHELEGLTFYVPDPATTCMTVNGVPRPDVERNPADHTGRRSISIRRRRLDFPHL